MHTNPGGGGGDSVGDSAVSPNEDRSNRVHCKHLFIKLQTILSICLFFLLLSFFLSLCLMAPKTSSGIHVSLANSSEGAQTSNVQAQTVTDYTDREQKADQEQQ